MSSKTKIVVLRMKELIYTGIFVALGILLILLLVYMFAPKDKKNTATADAAYTPGVYKMCIRDRSGYAASWRGCRYPLEADCPEAGS